MVLSNIPSQTLRKQRQASDPDASVWVSANAGSGKTHVLAQRVVRLLLARRAARRKSSASPSPRRRRRTWRRASSTRCRSGHGSTTTALARRSSRSARRTIRARQDSTARAAVRAHHRDAGRPEDPDHPRLLRKAAASVSRSRPMSPARLSKSLDERRRPTLSASSARRACSRPTRRADRRARRDARRVLAEDVRAGVRKLVSEAMGQRARRRRCAGRRPCVSLRQRSAACARPTTSQRIRDARCSSGALRRRAGADRARFSRRGGATDQKKAELLARAAAGERGDSDACLDVYLYAFFTRTMRTAKSC